MSGSFRGDGRRSVVGSRGYSIFVVRAKPRGRRDSARTQPQYGVGQPADDVRPVLIRSEYLWINSFRSATDSIAEKGEIAHCKIAHDTPVRAPCQIALVLYLELERATGGLQR